jgi:hypothetical protein
MKINRHNFEAYLLDQLEGTLSVEDQRELELFLFQNPDCAPELEELEPLALKGEKLVFRHPEILKKEFPDHSSVLHDHNFDLFSIARVEGDLKAEQIKEHQAMLEADQHKATLWKQWQETRLVVEPHIYPRKEQLKHKRPLKSSLPWIGVISAAAAIALLFVLFRPGAELPLPEVITQAPQYEAYGRHRQEPEPAEPVPVQDIIVEGVSAIQAEPEHTELFQTAQEITYSQETNQLEEAGEQPDMRPRVHAFSAQLFPGSYAIRKPDQDRITPLHIAPVPVSMRSLTLAQISDIGFQEVLEDYAEENNLTLWKIANAGIKGINKLTGSDISLMASHDEEGDISGYQLRSKRFSLTRPLGADE